MKLFLQSSILKVSLATCFLLFGIGMRQANAQVKFSAKANYNKIGINETVQLKYKVENAQSVKHIKLPDFKHFNIVSGPSQEEGMVSINGNTTRYTALSYGLKPTSSGTFTIPPATVMADGKEYKSNPVKITVTRDKNLHPGNTGNSLFPNMPTLPAMPNMNLGSDIPEPEAGINESILKPGENATEKIQKNLFLRLEVSKKDCYVGQPVIASFKLYTRLHSESSITGAPSFNGFSVSDLPVNNNEVIETYHGRQYSTYTLRKVQLYPLQSGDLTLAPLESDNKVTFLQAVPGRNSGDPFDDLMQGFSDPFAGSGKVVQKDAELKSQPVTIHVKPLPKINVPRSFTGAVGHFSIKASLQKNEFTTDDANNLVITIEGSGNLQMINAPAFVWPIGIDSYDSKVTDHIKKQDVPLSGNKVFTIPFTVSKPGDYTLPAIQFSWFDPNTATYDSTATQPMQFHVTAGKRIQTAGELTTNPQKAGWLANISKIEMTTGIILVLAIILLVLILLFKKRNREDELATKIKLEEISNRSEEEEEEFEIPENPLLAAHEKLLAEDSSAFYNTLNYSLKNYLAHKLKVPMEEITKKRISERLDECNVGMGTIRLTQSLMDDIDLHLYGGHAQLGQMKSVYEKAGELISLLDKQVCGTSSDG